MKELTTEYVEKLVASRDVFPVDIDQLWKLVSFTSKTHAKRLIEGNLKKQIDYQHTQVRSYGKIRQVYKLTIPASIKLCKIHGSAKGRRYIEMIELTKQKSFILPDESTEVKLSSVEKSKSSLDHIDLVASIIERHFGSKSAKIYVLSILKLYYPDVMTNAIAEEVLLNEKA